MIYCAAPFFNQPQLDLIQKIEGIFEMSDAPYFSPRKIGVLKPNASTSDRKEILKGNIEALQKASCVLAVLDFLLPARQTVQLVSESEDGHHFVPLYIPDSGVIWETAYAYALQIPVVGFVRESPRLNVMISETLKGVITSLDELQRFAATWDGTRFHYSNLKPWQGRTQ